MIPRLPRNAICCNKYARFNPAVIEYIYEVSKSATVNWLTPVLAFDKYHVRKRMQSVLMLSIANADVDLLATEMTHPIPFGETSRNAFEQIEGKRFERFALSVSIRRGSCDVEIVSDYGGIQFRH
nr:MULTISPECIES: hypothetical protein [unclassified Nocardia]